MNRQETLPLDEPERLGVGREEPRLWFEELRIYERPATLTRTVSFRRGLNIVWAPDESIDGQARGHDSGKTLLCRLLRFAVGEKSFAASDDMKRIRRATPEGFVAARVRIARETWCVVRTFANDDFGRAVRSSNLDAVIASKGGAHSLDAYRAALRGTLGTAVERAPSELADAWLGTLEWIARDQRCLDQPLLWRGKKRASWCGPLAHALLRLMPEQTPRPTTSKDPNFGRQQAALAGAQAKVSALEAELRGDDESVSSLPLTALQQERALAAQRDDLRRPSPPPETLEKAQNELSSELEHLGVIRGRAEANQAERKRLAKRVSDLTVRERDIEEHRADLRVAGIRVCSRCRRRLTEQRMIEQHDALLADEGSTVRTDLLAATKELARAEKDADTFESLVKERKASVSVLKQRVATLRGEYESDLIRRGEHAARVDRALATRAALRSAQAHADSLKAAMPEKPSARRALPPVPDPSQWATFSAALDLVTRQLFGGDASSHAKLTADGFDFEFRESGTHRAHGPGLTALGAIAFDLAALRMAIADKSELPGFWIHDSPRGANLGPGRFASLLRMMQSLHQDCGSAFQYILTSTDKPTEPSQATPFHEIRLGSATTDELLLKCRY